MKTQKLTKKLEKIMNQEVIIEDDGWILLYWAGAWHNWLHISKLTMAKAVEYKNQTFF